MDNIINIYKDIEGTVFPAGRHTRVLVGVNSPLKADNYVIGTSTVFPGGSVPEAHVHAAELERAIGAFVRDLPEAQRRVFLCRYWYLDSLAEIGKRFGYSESKVKSMLHRTREKLRNYLQKEELL